MAGKTIRTGGIELLQTGIDVVEVDKKGAFQGGGGRLPMVEEPCIIGTKDMAVFDLPVFWRSRDEPRSHHL